MDPVQARLGGRRDHGERDHPRGRIIGIGHGAIAPKLIDPRHGHQGAIPAVDEEGLLAWLALGVGRRGRDLPFVPALRWDQGPAGSKRAGIRRLLPDGFGARIDHPGATLDVLGPTRHQPPREQAQLAHRLLTHGPREDDRRLLGGRHIPVRRAGRGRLRLDQDGGGGLVVPVRLDIEDLDHFGEVRAGGIPPAHAAAPFLGGELRSARGGAASTVGVDNCTRP